MIFIGLGSATAVGMIGIFIGLLHARRAARTKLYVQAQSIFVEAAPWLPIAHVLQFVRVRNDVVRFVPDPLGRYLFEGESAVTNLCREQ
jgi:hypothetical protein